MKKNILRNEQIAGRVYSLNKLEERTSQNQNSKYYGQNYISGEINIAVDEDATQVIPVHYTFVTEMTNAGKPNPTFTALRKIINGKTWQNDSKEEATMVTCSPFIDVNDFVNADGEMISAMRNEGGFINVVNELPAEEDRNAFEADVLLTGVNRVEPEDAEPYLNLKGAVFNDYRKILIPVTFVIRNESGMDYFEGLGITSEEPILTKVWGRIVSTTIEKVTREEGAAFGEARVKKSTRKHKEYLVTGATGSPYDFDEVSTVITPAEVTECLQNREIHLADVKKRNDEYLASRKTGGNTSTASATPIKKQGFSF